MDSQSTRPIFMKQLGGDLCPPVGEITVIMMRTYGSVEQETAQTILQNFKMLGPPRSDMRITEISNALPKIYWILTNIS